MRRQGQEIVAVRAGRPSGRPRGTWARYTTCSGGRSAWAGSRPARNADRVGLGFGEAIDEEVLHRRRAGTDDRRLVGHVQRLVAVLAEAGAPVDRQPGLEQAQVGCRVVAHVALFLRLVRAAADVEVDRPDFLLQQVRLAVEGGGHVAATAGGEENHLLLRLPQGGEDQFDAALIAGARRGPCRCGFASRGQDRSARATCRPVIRIICSTAAGRSAWPASRPGRGSRPRMSNSAVARTGRPGRNGRRGRACGWKRSVE